MIEDRLAEADPVRGRGGMTKRQPRLRREELRDRLLDIGLSILREDGFGTGAEALTFKKVFDRYEEDTGIHLTNASVIRRVWHNQADFQADVLMAIAVSENENEFDLTAGTVGPILDSLDRSTPESREGALRELCRVGAAANLQAMRESANWPLWIGVWGVAAGAEPLDYRKKIEEALVSGYNSFNDLIEELYLAIMEFLGFRLREQFTLRQFTVAADSLGQGCGLRDRIDDSHKQRIMRATGPGGSEQEWTLFGVAFEALVQVFFEIDPHWSPDAGGA